MNKTILSAALAAQTLATGCPDLKTLRSQQVVDFFDVMKLDGTWYENAYQDIGQVGASCQYMVNTEPGPLGFKQDFKCKYSMVPFILPHTYEQVYENDEYIQGRFLKYVDGQKDTLTLPTVVVDYTTDEEGNYVNLTEFTCQGTEDIVLATELRFQSRDKTLDDATLAAMQARAVELGIPAEIVYGVNIVDQSHCKSATPDAAFLQ